MPRFRIVESIEVARATILRRRALEETSLPANVAQRVRDVFGADLTAEQVVDRIVSEVRLEGDAALRRFIGDLDGCDSAKSIEVPREAMFAAYDSVAPELVDALRLAAQRIEIFHKRQTQRSWIDFSEAGGLGQLVVPLSTVGIYCPGGRAVYPSTVLMTAIPAKAAGVKRVVLASPPDRDGSVAPLVLVAADIAGVDQVFAMGGAQAIAGLAYGTESVPRVDKIVGPGNIFVALAKKKVFGQVGIDQVAGPTETLVIADESADPRAVTIDLIAQAEHDPLAIAILVTTSMPLARKVEAEIDDFLKDHSRGEIARASLESNGGAVVVPELQMAFDLANDFAPEHLCLSISDPWSWIGHVSNAGGVFVGDRSPEAMGDYIAGPSHVMPTAGTARFASPLSVLDFVKIISVIALSEGEMAKLGPAAATIADAEGLTAHAVAIRRRLDRREWDLLGSW